MRLTLTLALLVACGGRSPEVEPVSVGPRPAPPAPPTCAEIGIIMRGTVDVAGADAGPEREKAIERSCLHDRWPSSVIECAASTALPTHCLAHLTAAQHAAYDARLAAWAKKWGVGATEQAGPPPIECKEALHAVRLFDPVIDDKSVEHDWAINTRLHWLMSDCTSAPWTEDTKICLRDAESTVDISICTAQFLPAVAATNQRINELAPSIAKLRKTPKKIDCKAVTKASTLTPEACAALDDLGRACYVAGGGELCR